MPPAPPSPSDLAHAAASAATATATAERVEQGLDRVEQGIKDVLRMLHDQGQTIATLATQMATTATRLDHMEQAQAQTQARLGGLEQISLPLRIANLETMTKAQEVKVDELLKAHHEARWMRIMVGVGLGGFASYLLDRILALIAKAP